jgi:protein-tyrosine phosphatase
MAFQVSEAEGLGLHSQLTGRISVTKKVLFVCMGNICRSPAGEAVMQRFAEEFGVDVEVDSAGTHDYHVGELADKRMNSAAEMRGYELLSRGRQVTPADLDPSRFDLVLAMDRENHALLLEMTSGPKSHIRLFGDYLDDQWPPDVPDPYYGDQDGFDKVLDMLEEGCPIILQTLVGEDIFEDEFE